jgi:hypothetical protein
VLVLDALAQAEPRVDWATGLVTAEGIGIADRHAPDPAVARGTARRPAEDAARKELRGKVLALPLAAGGKVGDRASDPAVKARLDRAIENAFAIAADPDTDGSWKVTMAVPIEGVRQALAGPRELPVAGDAPPVVVIVDGVTATPALGWKVNSLEAATVWVSDVPAYAKDAPHVKAKRTKSGTIELDAATGNAATLYVIIRPRA